MQAIFRGRVFATPSAMTVLVEGSEVFSGQVGVGQSLDTEITLLNYNMDGMAYNASRAVSVSVTSGSITVGPWWFEQTESSGYGADIRDSILINGSAPEWPATPVDPMPGGTAQDPDWDGWFFEVSAGETITFNIINDQPTLIWAPNTNYLQGQGVWHLHVLYSVNADCNSGSTFNPSQFTAV